MRNLKKKVILLLSALLIPALLVACKAEEKPKVVAPEESAKILYNVFIKSEKPDLSTTGLKQEDFDKVLQDRKELSVNQFRAEFTKAGVAVNEAQIEEAYNAIVEAYKKADVTTEVVTKTDTTAVVKVKTTYIDLVSIVTKAVTDAQTSLTGSGLSEQALKAKLVETYMNNLIAGIKNAQISTDTKEKTFDFVLKNNVWLPVDQEQYFASLDFLASGQSPQ
ncbi:MAG: hypothetical protein AB6733_16005 [Clostridiaceae bacterium]